MSELAAWMRLLELGGARNLGCYPDDFLTVHPALDGRMPPFSLGSQPE
jgi:hypothetical protein